MSEAKTSGNNVLRLTDITMQFGGVVAINNLSLEVNTGEIVALIGPNGAGKTTAFNCITGVYEPTNGAVYFHGKPIAVNHPQGKMIKQYGGINADKYKDQKAVVYTPDKITHMGIARTFQNIRLFKSQTAFENVLIGTHLRRTSNFLTATFRLNMKEEKAMREKASQLLEEVGLSDVANELATSLPYGKQRRLEIARALATDPTLLLLDEPAAGMNPQETDELGEFIVDIKNKFNLTVFMIEHHMNLVMDISDRIYVLDFGKQIAEGTPDEIQKNPVVIAAYLGVDEE
jgi:branched-chain amino acid transport system ATP-binding protein